MRIKNGYILLLINILTLTFILIINFLPNNILRIILGFLLVLFFPRSEFTSLDRCKLTGMRKMNYAMIQQTGDAVICG